MRKKYWLIPAVCLLMAMLACCGPGAWAAVPMNEQLNTESRVVDAQMVQDALYVLTGEGLMVISEPGAAATTVMQYTPEYIMTGTEILATDGTSPYILQANTGVLYRVEKSSLITCAQLDLSVIKDSAGESPESVFLDHPLIQDGRLFALCAPSGDSYQKKLYSFSLETGMGECLLGRRSWTEISPYRDHLLMALDADDCALMAIDPASGKTVEEIVRFSNYENGAAVYDQGKKQIYFIQGTEWKRLTGQKADTVDYLPFSGAVSAKCAGVWRDKCVILYSDRLYACATVPGQVRLKPLTIGCQPNGFAYSNILSDFMLRYPEIPVVLRNIDEEDAAKTLIMAALSGDDSVDLMILNNNLTDSYDVFQRGLAGALTSEKLIADVQSMYPQVQSYLTYDGELMAYPIVMYPNCKTVRTDLMREAGIDAVPRTVEEYLDVMVRWYDEHDAENPYYTFSGSRTVQVEQEQAVRMVFRAYLADYDPRNGSLSFDTPEFRALIAKIDRLSSMRGKEESSSADAYSTNKPQLFDFNASSPFTEEVNGGIENIEYILPFTLHESDTPIIGVFLQYIILTPNSTRKEEAYLLLEYLADKRTTHDQYILHPDKNELVEREFYQDDVERYEMDIRLYRNRIEDLEEIDRTLMGNGLSAVHTGEIRGMQDEIDVLTEKLAHLEESRWEFSQEALDAYRRLGPYLSLDKRRLTYQVAIEMDAPSILSRYFARTVPLDRALADLDRRLLMMYYEGM